MAKLKETEKLILERLFGMEGGYVLDFSNPKFQQFIFNTFKVDIYNSKYSVYGDSKAKRLRAFWDLENNQTVGKLILELIEVWETEKTLKNEKITENDKSLKAKAIIIGNKLLGIQNQTTRKEETLDDFLNKDFEIVSLEKLKIDTSVINILDSRILEIKNSIRSKSALSCVILCGSVLEGILLGIASNKMREFNQCEISPKDRKTTKVLPFNEWSLSNFIDVSHNLGLLGLDVKKYSHSMRDFRNYIHPYQQMASRFNPDIETAKISWQVLKAAITHLSKNV
ncbi:hypothetical protein [uncultured Christiangramia sp.]|uniref:hypothetical protein n=1 Tax=uncultured Christiangramia sp. TaxID=503836 RepID=UPI00260EEB13|nr:hypothetical protein [uncultured Christiangramia sp.]